MREKQSGQVLLIALLVAAMVSTIVIGLIGRSTTQTTITKQSEQSSRTFSAAEAGIEQALKTGQAVTDLPVGDQIVNVAPAPITPPIDSGVYSITKPTKQGQVETIWLAERNGSGVLNITGVGGYKKSTILVCWQPTARVEIMLVSNKLGNYMVTRKAFGLPTDSPGGFEGNNFLNPATAHAGLDGGADSQGVAACTNAGMSVSAWISLNELMCGVSADFTTSGTAMCDNTYPIALRIKPLYGDSKIAVYVPTSSQGYTKYGLPSQGKSFESTAQAADGTKSRILVKASYRAPSALFDYVLYSQGNLGLVK